MKGGVMMTVNRSDELVKTERPGYLSPFDEMDRWFERSFRSPFSFFGPSVLPNLRITDIDELSPSIDVFEEGSDLVMKADIPGVSKDDIDIHVENDVLTISGEKKKEEKIEKDNYYRYERSHGSFCRRFALPEGTDTEKIKANYKDGVLNIRIPKSETVEKKTKKISVT